jgi:hypothetical protein
MMKSLRGKLVALSFGVAMSGAAFAQAPTSQFLDAIPDLKPVPGVEGSYGWDNPKLQVASYDKLFLDDVQVFLAPDSPYKGIDSSQMAAITQTLRAAMIDALEPDYPVVGKPGQGVMRLSLAITGVEISKRKKRLLNYTPVGLVVGGLRRMADAFSNISLGAATVEADIVDIQTGERIAVRVATKPFAQANLDEGKMSWDALEAAFGFYAGEVRRSLDEAHGKK